MYDARELTVEQIGQVLGVSGTSIYRALQRDDATAKAAAATAAATPAVQPEAAQATVRRPGAKA